MPHKHTPPAIADHIRPLYMNGLSGRMLLMPASRKKSRQILLVYGHHASIERMAGLAEELSKYGDVTLPDLPGFGGMESFYKIGERPSLDTLADYLASFIKLRYKRRRFSIMAMSFGFLIATRMLQRYPELAKRVDIVISIVGFAHYEDFKYTGSTIKITRVVAGVMAQPFPAAVTKHLLLRGPIIRSVYRLVAARHSKLHDADEIERKKRIDFEVELWKCNDFRTYMATTKTMFSVDLCHKSLPLDVHHVSVAKDRYFNNDVVEQHLGVIYQKVTVVPSKMLAHAPTVVADAKAAAPFIPRKLRGLLAKP